jgi:hypothetical protein
MFYLRVEAWSPYIHVLGWLPNLERWANHGPTQQLLPLLTRLSHKTCVYFLGTMGVAEAWGGARAHLLSWCTLLIA